MLTLRQAEIHATICAGLMRGCPPTVHELCQRFGFKSPNALTCHFEALRRKGYLAERSRGAKARAFTVLRWVVALPTLDGGTVFVEGVAKESGGYKYTEGLVVGETGKECA